MEYGTRRPRQCNLSHPEMATYRDEDWLLETHTFLPNHFQTAPHVSNGYFGQTLPSEGVGYWIERAANGEYAQNTWPLDQPRATFGTIAGFWNLQDKVKYISTPENVERGGESTISGIPDWTGLVVTTADGKSYLPGVDQRTVKKFYQSLSIRDGIVKTSVTWAPTTQNGDDIQYALNFTVFAHRKRPNVGVVKLELMANQSTTVTITDVLDGAGAVRAHFGDKGFEEDENVIWTSVKPWGVEDATAYVLSSVQFSSPGLQKGSRRNAITSPVVSKNLSTVAQSWTVNLEHGKSFAVSKYAGIASTDGFPQQAFTTAKKAALEAKAMPWSVLVSEHRQEWEETWDSADIIIPGDKELQRSVRASLFHTFTDMPHKIEGRGLNDNSLMPGGLSSESYAGLIFWDAETWIYPSVLALHPQYARAFTNYRSRLLPQAIENAQSYGFSGALFPWTSGRYGNCTNAGRCESYQYHLNTDIALAHWQYFQSTNDIEWLKQNGWPIIKSVADMFAAFVVLNRKTGKFDTVLVGEPDEFAFFKNNGAFTNTGIKMLLSEYAPAAARILNQEIPQNWSEIAEKISIPMNLKENITLEFEEMPGDWKVKQASVALMNYPLEYRIDKDWARHDLDYYSIMNTYVGPAMTWSIFSINEAQLQTSGCAAYTYLLRSSEPYLRGPFYKFSETTLDKPEKDGDDMAFPFGLNPAFPFLTGAGGFLQVYTHGLTGMRLSEDALYFNPVLPPQIPEGVTVKGIKWQDASFDIAIGAEITTITRRRLGLPQDIVPSTVRIGSKNSHPGEKFKEYTLKVGESLAVTTRRPDIQSLSGGVVENKALCKTVTSDDHPWSYGRYPLSAVDGSNATVWQPTSATKPASMTIDLGDKTDVSGFFINWGASPAATFTIYSDEIKLYGNKVKVSAPYNRRAAQEVKIRRGNTTEVILPTPVQTRRIRLMIEGTQGEDQHLGATVAEFIVI
ncbi:putative maltose phosphorylase [Talaromyces proteolyticus]|uniref:alpha,alpha-trehalase n=1 Tax=Talaromyces proteolyticus TaxID=1131652 RepID=A0AAD4KZ89_9EURO|nr:putative maltose phosphorylase [Talaromyces proteolyticus]KAH8703343.1 putative maltose phosphorylase [Talaromyces proteolyticus]